MFFNFNKNQTRRLAKKLGTLVILERELEDESTESKITNLDQDSRRNQRAKIR